MKILRNLPNLVLMAQLAVTPAFGSDINPKNFRDLETKICECIHDSMKTVPLSDSSYARVKCKNNSLQLVIRAKRADRYKTVEYFNDENRDGLSRHSRDAYLGSTDKVTVEDANVRINFLSIANDYQSRQVSQRFYDYLLRIKNEIK